MKTSDALAFGEWAQAANEQLGAEMPLALEVRERGRVLGLRERFPSESDTSTKAIILELKCGGDTFKILNIESAGPVWIVRDQLTRQLIKKLGWSQSRTDLLFDDLFQKLVPLRGPVDQGATKARVTVNQLGLPGSLDIFFQAISDLVRDIKASA